MARKKTKKNPLHATKNHIIRYYEKHGKSKRDATYIAGGVLHERKAARAAKKTRKKKRR